MSDLLKYGDLDVGDRFIAFPQSGDDDGHGGFRGTYFIFMKRMKSFGVNRAVKLSTGTISNMPDSMLVIKVE